MRLRAMVDRFIVYSFLFIPFGICLSKDRSRCSYVVYVFNSQNKTIGFSATATTDISSKHFHSVERACHHSNDPFAMMLSDEVGGSWLSLNTNLAEVKILIPTYVNARQNCSHCEILIPK